MSQKAVWIDHHKAFIYDYQKDGIHERKLELKHDGKVTKEFLRKFYHDVAESLKNSEAILVLGPGQAKEEFKNHCEEHHANVNKAIVRVESMKDHPTEAQILKISNEFFKQYHSFKGY